MKRLVLPLVFQFMSAALFGQGVPDLTNINPKSGNQGATVAVTLTGTNFATGATSVIVTGAGVIPVSVRVDSPTSAVATLVLTGIPGKYPLKITTTSGTSANSQTFTVNGGAFSTASEFEVTSVVGPDGGAGSSDGATDSARFARPYGIWADATYAYVADSSNGTIRRVTLSNGQTTTIAGTAGVFGNTDATGSFATFFTPVGIWGDGTNLYVTDRDNFNVRIVEISTGRVTTLAGSPETAALVDGTGTQARFVGPTGIWGDGAGNLYVADHYYSLTTRSIRKIVIATGAVTTVGDLGRIAGSTIPGTAIFGTTLPAFPIGLWGDGTNLWIADSGKATIRKMVLISAQITTHAGTEGTVGASDASGTNATFRFPSAIWGDGTNLYVADTLNYTLRRVSPSTAQVATIAGTNGSAGMFDGTGSAARFGSPAGIGGSGGNVYITETTNHVVRRVILATTAVGLLSGRPARPGTTDGGGSAARFFLPYGIGGDASSVYIGDFLNSTVRKFDIGGSNVTTFAGRVGIVGHLDSAGVGAVFAFPAGVWADGTSVYVTDPGFDTVRKITADSVRNVTTFAGSPTAPSGFAEGQGTSAVFHTPYGLWGDGTNLYVADSLNYSIRMIVLSSRTVSTLAGNRTQGVVDGVGSNTRFYLPVDVWGDGTNLYVLDGNGVRKIALATGQVSSFAGSVVTAGNVNATGLNARFRNPQGLWGDGSNLFIADTGNHLIRKIDLQTAVVSTIAGLIQGSEDGKGSAGRFNGPTDIWGDGTSLYIVDQGNNKIRKVTPVKPPDPTTTTNPGDVTYRIIDRAGLSRVTSGAGNTQVGYARILPTGNSNTPSGMAIFGFRQGGTLVSEAAVPASPLVRAGRIYAQISGSVNTGVAIANPNSQAATISFYFTDANGVNQLTGTTTVAANGQVAAFLDQAPFLTNESFRPNLGTLRTFTFSSSIPIAVVALRGLTNERSEFLITTLPVTSTDQSSTTSVSFPHYADGGGWKTQVVLVNPTDSSISGSVQFFSQGSATAAGAAATLTANSATANSFNYTIAARSSFKLETSGTDPGVKAGWVRVTPSGGAIAPSGLVVFSYRANGVTVSEAGVAALQSATASRLYAEVSGDFNSSAGGAIQTGFAISNPSSSSVTINFEITTLDGISTGLTGNTTVPASGQVAMFLNQIQGFGSLPNPFQGVLRVTGANVFVTGLRGRYNERGDFLITTTAPIDENASASTTEMVFPHLADGGGYTTQFILFSGTAGSASNGLLRFFSQSGGALGFTLR